MTVAFDATAVASGCPVPGAPASMHAQRQNLGGPSQCAHPRYPLRVPIASASSLTLAALAILICAACDAPIGAIRRSPPADIAGHVLPTRAKAPAIALEGTQGSYKLADALAQGPALLVFYRGHW